MFPPVHSRLISAGMATQKDYFQKGPFDPWVDGMFLKSLVGMLVGMFPLVHRRLLLEGGCFAVGYF
jgi:hypothetical protein